MSNLCTFPLPPSALTRQELPSSPSNCPPRCQHVHGQAGQQERCKIGCQACILMFQSLETLETLYKLPTLSPFLFHFFKSLIVSINTLRCAKFSHVISIFKRERANNSPVYPLSTVQAISSLHLSRPNWHLNTIYLFAISSLHLLHWTLSTSCQTSPPTHRPAGLQAKMPPLSSPT